MNRRALIARRAKALKWSERAARAVEAPELELDQVEVSKPAAAIPAEPAPGQELDFG